MSNLVVGHRQYPISGYIRLSHPLYEKNIEGNSDGKINGKVDSENYHERSLLKKQIINTTRFVHIYINVYCMFGLISNL